MKAASLILLQANNLNCVASAEAMANELLASDMPLETPFLLMERNKIQEQIERWNRYLPFVSIHYAVKANSDPLLIQLLADQGCNFDVASASEMEQVSKLNISGNRMVLSHPAKTERTLRAMAVIQPWAFAVDTTTEVDRVVAHGLPSETYDPVLFVRLKTQSRGPKVSGTNGT